MNFMNFLLVLFVLTTSIMATAQDTNLTWTGFDLRIPLDSKSQIDLKPIMRHNLNGDGYQNSSLDVSYKRSFYQGFFAQLLGRTWFMPEARYRLFFWLDVGKNWSFDKFKLTQKLRIHYALDVNDNFDADFVRLFTTLTLPLSDKLKVTLNLEPWLSLNDDIGFSRYRIEPGFAWSINNQLSLGVVYRRQSDFLLNPINYQNHIVSTIVYKLGTGQ